MLDFLGGRDQRQIGSEFLFLLALVDLLLSLLHQTHDRLARLRFCFFSQ